VFIEAKDDGGGGDNRTTGRFDKDETLFLHYMNSAHDIRNQMCPTHLENSKIYNLLNFILKL